jgi:RHS repeat-associated protein
MSGTETVNLQNNAQVGVVGGYALTGQTSLVNSTTGQKVTPVTVTSPGDPFAFLPVPTQGTIIGKSHTSYDMNNKPANNTLLPGTYCGGLTIGNTNGTTFTMSPGTYIMAGGGFTVNSLGIINGSGVTVYNTSSSGWGCSASSSYTPITISGQANVTLTAPSTGALAGMIFFGDRAGCSTLGNCQDQINSGSITKLNGAMYFKTDTLVFSGTASNTGCMTVAADKININGNSSFAVTGCTGTVGGVAVSVSPITASLYAGQTQQFSATVTNAASTAVTWSVSGGGSISSTGLYTAPSSVTSQQTVTITATSVAEPTISASATVTLLPPISVSVSPKTASLYGGQTEQFSASVSNTSNTAVTWAISPSGTGTINSSGLYTAPSTVASQQTVTITATSAANTSASASATVMLVPPVSVSVTPTSAALYPSQTQQFVASVANTSNTAVTWSISPSGTGSINSSGLYTAPASIAKLQNVTVTATSQADATKSATASVTVNIPQPSIASITPSPAAPGTPVTITGQNFLSSTGTVTLNGVTVPTTSWNNTAITLVVPTSNCTGSVTVTTQYGTSNAVTLTISGTQVGCLYPAPVANAGPAQTVSIGAVVQLDGTGSTDLAGNSLTYSWSFVSIPSGSAASISTPTSSKPTFVADVYGSYTVQLIVNDGYHNSAASQVIITTKDSAPVANAGPNQTVPTRTPVQLNGSESTDVDGNTLTYAWSFVSVPTGSATTLSNPTSVAPTFTTDKKGTYTVQLVVNDGILNSAASIVTISDVNTPPVANAGPNQTVEIGTTVQLNGSGSTDADGDSLTYRWSILSAPAGSLATLSNTTIVNPTFVAGVPGNFVVQLIVNDGTVDGPPSTVTIGNQDIAPVAKPGTAQKVAVGALVSLDGTSSTDSDNKSLTYLWSIISAPAQSQATLTSSADPNPAFTADKYGNYIVQLVVNDGYLNSIPATVLISTIYVQPTANPGSAQTVTTGATVSLSGAASSSNDGYPLSYQWSLLSVPTGSAATLSNPTSVAPSFVADVAGAYVVQLIVNDTVSNSTPQTVMITAVPPNQPPVVNAGPNQAAYYPSTVTLSGTATDDGLPLGSTLTVQWTQVSGPGSATFANPSSAATTVTFSQPGTYVLQLSANDTQYTTTGTCTITYLAAVKLPPIVSAGPSQTIPIPNNLPLQGSVTSANTPPGTPTAQWSVVSTTPSGLTATFGSSTSPASMVSLTQAGVYRLQLTGTESGLSASATVTITAQAGNQPPVVNAGPNQTIELPASATLTGSATDDGLPIGSVLSYAWSQVSGPGTATISRPTSPVTAVSCPIAGTYIFRLAVSDTQLTGSAEVTVTVLPINKPPIVSAGQNQTIELPSSAQLSGSATDDGLPSGILNTWWSIVSGPGPVTFSNSSAPTTIASFSTAGTYVLQLNASDTQYTTSSDVTVTVVPVNTPPVVYAGSDFIASINIPATLNGSVTDDGLPLTGHLTSIWTQVSGPGAVQFTSASSPVTTASFSQTGSYVLKLTASDGALQTSATVSALVGATDCTSSNSGTDFWLMFPANAGVPSQYLITGKVNTTGVVSQPGASWSQAFSVSPGQVTTVTLPAQSDAGASDGVENKGLHITANDPVVVYGFYPQAQASDGYLGLPTYTLGTEYIVASYVDSLNIGTEFGIVAPFDGTTITITPSTTVPLYGVPSIRTAGTPYTVTLNQGQTYQLRNVDSIATIDLTGTIIQSDKPVAAFSGHMCGNVPTNYAYCNYLVEQLVPTNLWGQTFGTVPLAERLKGDTFRVIAAQDGTKVSINGQYVTSIDRGHFYETQLTTASFITASAPIEVVQYSDGTTYDGVNADPMMMLIPPFEQYGGDYTYATPTDARWRVHYLNVIVPTTAQSSVALDGAPVDTSSFVALPGSQFVAGSVQVAAGTHTITAGLPFDIHMYGWADYDAYGYPGGACLNQSQANVTISMSPQSSTQNVGIQQCVSAQVNDLSGAAVGGIGVQFSSSGANLKSGFTQTNAAGAAQFCYTGSQPGSDIVKASVASNSSTATIQWVASPNAPIVSIAQLSGVQISVPFQLVGSVSYTGAGTLSFAWQQLSGPSQASLTSPTSLQTTALATVAGSYVFNLRATDGTLSGFATVTVSVAPPPAPSNSPPTVSAGPDQTITMPTSATLNGSVTDDGLPVGATVTQQWSQVSGPAYDPPDGYAAGEIVVVNHSKVQNSDQDDFPLMIAGSFPFLATVSNGGSVQNSNGWDIIFTSDIAGQVQLDHEIDSYDPITGNAAFWIRIPTLSHTTDTVVYMWYGNSTVTATKENIAGVWRNHYLSVYHLGNGTSVSANDSGSAGYVLSGTAAPEKGIIGGAAGFTGNPGTYLYHDSVSAYPSGSSPVTIEAWAKIGSEGNTGDIAGYGDNSWNGSRIALAWDGSNEVLDFENMGVSGPWAFDTNWHHLVGVYGGGSLGASSDQIYLDGVTQSESVDGGTPAISPTEFKIGGIPTVRFCCAFYGSVDEVRISDIVRSADWVATEYNNQSSPSAFYTASSFQGGLVTFSTPTAPVTAATFAAPGTYVVQLSANDTQYTSTSQATVVVYPPAVANKPPVVFAGPNQVVTLPGTATLSGTVTDDGLPVGASVTSLWSILSGPAATIGDPSQLSTTVTFSRAGTYVLQLSANDTQYINTSALTIVVNPAVTTKNQPPSVAANPSTPAVVGVPLALNGTATDDGLPNGTLTVSWTQLSGPAVASFSNASTAASTVTFSAAGTYVLQLSACDSQYTTTLTLPIVVSTSATAAGGTNQPPVVSAGISQTITLPTNSLMLNGFAKDDGLPNNQLSVLWTQLSGPAPAVFSNAASASTLATFSVSGVYLLQLSANDGQYTTLSTSTVTVNPARLSGGPSVNQAPVVAVSGPGTVTLPNYVATLIGVVSDDGLPVGSTLGLQWSQLSGPTGAVIVSPNQASTQVTFAQAGTYVFQLSANDTQLTTTAAVTVVVGTQPGQVPVVQISQPLDGASVKSPTLVMGSVSSGNWTLSYAPLSNTGTTGTYTAFASGTGAVSGTLGTLDPSNLQNGTYSILLYAQDQWGQTASASVSVAVAGNLKLGAFTIAFQDLSVPLSGLPITVTRTYDSRNRAQGDFGDGWALSIANVRVQKSGGALGQTWDEESSWSGYYPVYCLQMAKNHTVTATFPDGRVYEFTPTIAQSCQPFNILYANLAFNQVSTGSNTAGARLSVLDGGNVIVSGTQGPVDLLDYNGNYYDSTQFKLTTADGYTYYLDMTLGVTKLVDPNGNTLTINSSGVVSSSGPSVAFSRDSLGRILSIADPTGALITYQYSSAGDLTSVTDRAQNTTTFGYDSNHYLTTITDPRGVSAVKNNYDSSGRLISTTDANGNTIKYTPNLSANQEQIADQLGNITLYTYDNDGNITQKVDPLGNVTSYTYDANDNQLTQTVYLGSKALTTTYTYDAVGDKLTQVDPLGNTTTYTYNSLKQVLTVTDALKRTTTNSYDGNGNLTSTTDPNGKVTNYSYNGSGTVASVTDPLKNTTSFGYDGSGNLTSQVDALGNTSSYTYDANNNKLSQTVTRTLANGTSQTLTTSYEYDGNNRLTKTHLPDGTYTQVHYNSIGKQDQSWDAKRNQTTYVYDNTGRLTSTAYADGTSDSTGYDADGHRTSYTDRGGHNTTYTFDAAGRMTTTTYADGSTSTTNYDSASRVTSTVDRNGNTTSYSYDNAGRRTGLSDALGNTTTFAYDAASQQSSVTDANNNTVQYTYDADGRQILVTYPDQSTSQTGYDALGRMVTKTDQAGVVTGYGYDSLGRLTSVTQDVGGLNLVTSYGYDQLGNRITQSDAAGRTTKYAYDQLGRRSQRTLPLGQVESYAYDADGNLAAKTDFNGHTTSYAYDAVNRLLAKTPDASFQASPVAFTYTATGKRQTMTDPSGTTTYSYEPQTDRLVSKQTPFGSIAYTYDAAGDVTQIASSNASGSAVAYQYDKLNRLSTVTVPGQSPTNYSYDAVGNLAGYTYPNGVTTALQYDPLNRLTSLASQGPQGAAASYQYTLGLAGNRTGVTELGGRTVSYGYDNLYRLTSETIANDASGLNGAVGYTYDAVGNRRQITSTLAAIPSSGLLNYDANDRTLTDQYDANGNTISQAGIADSYDFENHLTQHGYITYVYDGDGNRVAKTIGGVTTSYLVDTLNPTGYAQVLDEVQSTGVVRSYAWGLELVSETQLVAATPPASPWQTSWYGYDGHGSVRYLTDASGAVTDTYTYDAFGNLINSTGSTPNLYLFAGEQFDPDLGLYYNRARYLDVRVGRFWGMDTYEGDSQSPSSLHKYLYASANPVSRIDPSGHDDMAELGMALAVSVTLETMAIFSVNQYLIRPTYQIIQNQVVKDGFDGLYKNWEVQINLPGGADKYVVVQWIQGTYTINGTFAQTNHQGMTVPINFPSWEIDSLNTTAGYAESGGASIKAPTYFVLIDTPGRVVSQPGSVNVTYTGERYNADLQFIDEVYLRSQVGSNVSDFRAPWDPTPVLTIPWSFDDSYTIQ